LDSHDKNKIPLTTRYHLAITYDGTTLKGYIDGALIGSVAASGNGASGVFDNFLVGCVGGNAGSYNNSPDGVIASPEVYNRAISQAEVTQLALDNVSSYQAFQNLLTSAWGAWDLSNLMDISGNGRNLTNTNGVTFDYVDGKQVANFGATNVTKNLIIQGWTGSLYHTSSMSVFGLVNIQQQNNVLNGSYSFWSRGTVDAGATYGWYHMPYFVNGSGVRQLAFHRMSSSASAVSASINITLNPGQWYSVCGTWDSTTGLMSFYLDGVLVATNTCTGSFSASTVNSVTFGTWFDSRTTGTTSGYASNFIQYDQRVLTAGEVALLDRYTKKRLIKTNLRGGRGCL
jgi:hypothetical protein